MQLTKTSTETTRVNETLNIITIYVLSISFHSRAASRVKMFRSSKAKFSFMLHQVRATSMFYVVHKESVRACSERHSKLYEFENWGISGGGARLAEPPRNVNTWMLLKNYYPNDVKLSSL